MDVKVGGGRLFNKAVIMRKTSGCNRTEGGCGNAFDSGEYLGHLSQHALPMVDFLVKVQRAVGGVVPLLVPTPQLDTS